VDTHSSDFDLAKLDRYRIPGVRFLGTDTLHHVMLDGTRFFLPLGWRLSRRSMDSIQQGDNDVAQQTLSIVRAELMGEDTTLLPPTR